MSYSRFVPERWQPITKTGACLRSLGLGVGTLKKVYHARRPGSFETPVKTEVTEVTRWFDNARVLYRTSNILRLFRGLLTKTGAISRALYKM